MNRNKNRLLSVIFACFLGIFAITGNAMAANDMPTTDPCYNKTVVGPNGNTLSCNALYDVGWGRCYQVSSGVCEYWCTQPTAFRMVDTPNSSPSNYYASQINNSSRWYCQNTLDTGPCVSASTSVDGQTYYKQSLKDCKKIVNYSPSTPMAAGTNGTYAQITFVLDETKAWDSGTTSSYAFDTDYGKPFNPHIFYSLYQTKWKYSSRDYKCTAGYHVNSSRVPCLSSSSDNTLGCLSGGTCYSPSNAVCTAADMGYCKACAAGTYKSGTNTKTSCTSCAKGTYQPSTGQSSCSNCGPGYACPNTGMTTRNNCGNGYYSSGTKNQSCSKCDCGHKCSGTNVSSQTECPAGQYQSSEGATSCTACTGSTYSLAGSCSCQSKPYNAYGVTSDHTNIICDSGSYKVQNQYSGGPWYYCARCPMTSGGETCTTWSVWEGSTSNGYTTVTTNGTGKESITDCYAYQTRSDTKGTYRTPNAPYSGDAYAIVGLANSCAETYADNLYAIFPDWYTKCAQGYWPWVDTDYPNNCINQLAYQWAVNSNSTYLFLSVPMSIAQDLYNDVYYSDHWECFTYYNP